jgi:hypothetical protein
VISATANLDSLHNADCPSWSTIIRDPHIFRKYRSHFKILPCQKCCTKQVPYSQLGRYQRPFCYLMLSVRCMWTHIFVRKKKEMQHWCCKCGLAQHSQYSNLLQAGQAWDWIPVGARFSTPVQNGPGAYSASYTMVTRSPLRVQRLGAWRWPPTPM